MKNLLSLAAVLMMATAAHAQLYVGASVEASTNNVSGDGKSYTNQNYELSPEVGYNINDVLAVGISGNLMYTVNGAPGSTDFISWGIEPYLRAKFANVSSVHFFCDLAYTYEKATPDVGDYSFDGWAITLAPGILVDLTDHLQLAGRTALFQYSRAEQGSYILKQTNFRFPSKLSIGLVYNF